jgi:carboxypeptidase Taq
MMARKRRAIAKRRSKATRTRRSSESVLAELKARLREISDLGSASAVLSWDQATYMPEGGADARGRQMAMLSQLAHERSVVPAIGKLIEALVPYGEGLAVDGDDARLIRVTRRNYEKAIKVPAEYVARVSAHASASYQAWTQARPANDFKSMVPYLEKTLDLSREYSGFFAPYKHIADPFIDDADEGMTTATIKKLFGELKRGLVPLVNAICDQPAVDDSCIRQDFPKPGQLEFAKRAAERMGYDFKRGRLDLTHHPFCTRFSAGDVRITTRVNEVDLGDALFSTVHEAGHAMYEQGVDPALAGTPVGHGVSAGVHESQSRLWENIVARSRGFWDYFYPSLQRVFALSSQTCRSQPFTVRSTRWRAR